MRKKWSIRSRGMVSFITLFYCLLGNVLALSPPQGNYKWKGWAKDEIEQRYKKFETTFHEFLISKGILRQDYEAELDEFMKESFKTGKGLYLSSTPGMLVLVGILAQLRAGQQVLDLGTGKGVAAIFLASFFDVQVVGIEWDKRLWKFSEEFRTFAKGAGVINEGQVRFIGPEDPDIMGDFLKHSWRGYDAIYYFAYGSGDFSSIAQKLKKELKEGAVFIYWGYPREEIRNRMDEESRKETEKEIQELKAAGFDMEYWPDYLLFLVRQKKEVTSKSLTYLMASI